MTRGLFKNEWKIICTNCIRIALFLVTERKKYSIPQLFQNYMTTSYVVVAADDNASELKYYCFPTVVVRGLTLYIHTIYTTEFSGISDRLFLLFMGKLYFILAEWKVFLAYRNEGNMALVRGLTFWRRTEQFKQV